MKEPTHSSGGTSPIRVVWPPPGLERYQGIFRRAAVIVGFGGSLLAVPIVLGVATPQPFHSLGFFGSAWWVFGLISILGLFVVVGGLAELFSFLRSARKAALHGIDLQTILHVAADHDGEVAPLIQGTRGYRDLDEKNRTDALRARVWTSLFFLLSAGWIASGWVVSLLLATRGLLGPQGFWMLSLGPAGLPLFAGLVTRGIEGTALRGASQGPLWDRWGNPGVQDAAEIWGEELRRFREERGEPFRPGTRPLLSGVVSVVGLAALVVVPTLGFTAISSVGPTLASMAVPKFSATVSKAGMMEAVRHLRIPSDPTITPFQAGEALNALVAVSESHRTGGLFKAPVRSFPGPFFPPGSDNPTGVATHLWPRDLFPSVSQGISPGVEGYLRKIAAHPGLGEFETLALAEAMDVLGPSYNLPFPEEMSAYEMPIPRFSGFREGAYAMVAKAAVQFLDGDAEAAERTLLVLLSAGVRVADDHPMLIGSLLGTVVAASGANALESFYEASGRRGEAESLRSSRAVAERAVGLAWSSTPLPRMAGDLSGMPGVVNSASAVRGMRWEYLTLLMTLSDCSNPHQVIFGPNEPQAEFLQTARASLVRYPSEEALFQLIEREGTYLPETEGVGRAAVGIARTLFGGRAERCAAILSSQLN